jgi:hypothetical protein
MPTTRRKTMNILEKKTWEDSNFIIESDAIKTARTQGVATRTLKKYNSRPPMSRKSFFIHKDQNVVKILSWLLDTVGAYFRKFWDKSITLKQVERSQQEVETLKNELIKRGKEHEELKKKYDDQKKELELAKEVIKNAQKYEDELSNFEEVVKQSVKENRNIEELVKEKIKENRWLLGLDCEVKAKNKDIDIETEIDLHIETNYGEQRIIEVKSPNIKIFSSRHKNGGRMNISNDVAIGLSELIEYMRRTDISSGIQQRGVYGIQKPIGRVLVGYDLTQEEAGVLNDWNFYLAPYIKIITYKELINSARKEIALIKATEKQLRKK